MVTNAAQLVLEDWQQHVSPTPDCRSLPNMDMEFSMKWKIRETDSSQSSDKN